MSRLRKIVNSEDPTRTLLGKMTAKINQKCDPALNDHTLDDITGKGAPGVAVPINTANIDSWCDLYGGDGSIDTLQEWIDCVAAAADCEARQAISVQFPRALEWMDTVRPFIVALDPSSSDPKVQDALTALDAINAAIEGDTDDDVPEITCPDTCGNGFIDGSEQCDGSDLGGNTCTSLGFAGGTLGCTSACQFDTSGCACLAGGFPVTGQTSCFNTADAAVACTGVGQDGDTQAGSPFSFTDNGDGTLTDNNTGLMWEKKDDSGAGDHYVLQDLTWKGTCAIGGAACFRDADCTGANAPPCQGSASPPEDTIWNWIDRLNTGTHCSNAKWKACTSSADCGGQPCNVTGFAGFTDWRIPNVKELNSIADYEQSGSGVAAIPAEFDNCTAGCSDLSLTTCSCVDTAKRYWSSTTNPGAPDNAYAIRYEQAGTAAILEARPKTNTLRARAVRGGS